MRDMVIAMGDAAGLSSEDAATVRELVRVWRRHLARNRVRELYYSMHARPRDLGISVPPNLRQLEQVVGWPEKAVKALADRSQFDGFVCDDEDASSLLAAFVARNSLKRGYRQSTRAQLEFCCTFLTVTDGSAEGESPRAVVSAYPATAASAIWDYGNKRIKAGLVVVECDERSNGDHKPVWVNVFTGEAMITLRREPGGSTWTAVYRPYSMGRCVMEAMPYDATLTRPFGRSRITRSVMDITDDAMRASVRAEVSGEFFTSPQKFLLGADEDALGDMTKWDAYIGNIFAVGKDEDGDVPQFGQLSQGTMQPHIDYMRHLAARFSGETSVPVSSLGVISDNPSSAEAIYAAKEDLVIEAQNLNADNGDALRNVATMALAIERGTDFAAQEALGLTIQPRFRNPAMPSVVSQADAITKMISALPWLAESDVALEEYGFADDQIQRLRSDRRRATAQSAIAALNTSSSIPRSAAEGE